MGLYIVDTEDLSFDRDTFLELAYLMYEVADAMQNGNFTVNDNGLANEQMRQVLIRDVQSMAKRLGNIAPYIQPRPIKNYTPRSHDGPK